MYEIVWAMTEVPVSGSLLAPKGSDLPNYRHLPRPNAALLPNSSGCVAAAATLEGLNGNRASFVEDVVRPLDLAGETTLIIRRLMLLLSVAALAVPTGQAFAQGAFPAPLPNQAPLANDSAFPPVNGAAPAASVGAPPTSFPVTGAAPLAGAGFERAPGPPQQQAGVSEQCMKAFLPLREEAEKRGKLIKVASERHASPVEACELIKNFSQAEIKMMKYVESHSKECGIPPQVPQQMKVGHKNTENMQQKGPAGPSLSEVLGSAAALPEATTTKKGASTFDTLNGNVLTR
ncbi:MAG TPA: hypothetical protein VII41_06505 [Steroidobacteraceae bacterium]